MSTSRDPGPGAAHDTPPGHHGEAHPPNLILRPKQPAPTGDGVKNLRPLTRAPYRALLDPAAYFDAPQTRAEPEEKINYKNTGLTGPAPTGMTARPGKYCDLRK